MAVLWNFLIDEKDVLEEELIETDNIDLEVGNTNEENGSTAGFNKRRTIIAQFDPRSAGESPNRRLSLGR